MFGSHLSISGGMHNAIDEAVSLKMDTVQVFTKNQQRWVAKPLEDDAIREWTSRIDDLGWQGRVVSHASYLINLASPDDELWEKSIDGMLVEIERCETLGIENLVHHPGAYTTSTFDEGAARIAKAYKRLFKLAKGYRCVMCLEDTAGGGSTMGRTFEELAAIRRAIVDATGEPDRVGYCLDTCHLHAGGYDMSDRAKADAALDEFDKTCGLRHVRALHLNDSKVPMGSRKDRHEHIGEGTIGRPPGPSGTPKQRPLKDTGFAAVVNRAELRDVPKIMETPKGEDENGKPHDARNLRRLRGLVGK